MMLPLKASLKRIVGRTLKTEFLEKLTEYSIAETASGVSLGKAQLIKPSGSSWVDIIDRGRETLWARTLEAVPGTDILLLEFGVWQGVSTRKFVQLNSSAESRFFGFDSFEGLPEDWRGMAAERFDVGGAMPKIDDPRVRFVKGWFRDSLPPIMEDLVAASGTRSLIVHFDADLYSSTLYLLFTLGARFKRFHFIFDEFSGHETRALHNFMQATGAEATFLYRLDWRGCPQVISGELIIP